jgi:hypothetical protein
MAFKPEDIRKVVVALTLGGIAGAAIVQSHHDEAKKSRAKIDDPEGTEWICNIVWDLLDDWEPPDMDPRVGKILDGEKTWEIRGARAAIPGTIGLMAIGSASTEPDL